MLTHSDSRFAWAKNHKLERMSKEEKKKLITVIGNLEAKVTFL
jgi:hypothetical protein